MSTFPLPGDARCTDCGHHPSMCCCGGRWDSIRRSAQKEPSRTDPLPSCPPQDRPSLPGDSREVLTNAEWGALASPNNHIVLLASGRIIDRLVAEVLRMRAASNAVFACIECDGEVKADEDGCCSGCGADCFELIGSPEERESLRQHISERCEAEVAILRARSERLLAEVDGKALLLGEASARIERLLARNDALERVAKAGWSISAASYRGAPVDALRAALQALQTTAIIHSEHHGVAHSGATNLKETAMPIDQATLDNWFSYHKPTEGQPEVYEQLRAAGKAFAEKIVALTPPSADQTAAIRHVRDAVFTANAAIACGGR